MNATQPQKVGIMGGTFDPIHYGHLLIAQSAAEEFTLDQVLFLPTGKAPHKSYQHVTDPERRCDMVKLAISDNPKFKLSFLEVDHTEVNYTYLTLQKMKEQFNNSKFYFIMGEDSLDDFQNWKRPEEICRLAVILVASRNAGKSSLERKLEDARKLYSAEMFALNSPDFSVSSREIRERVREGKRIRGKEFFKELYGRLGRDGDRAEI